MILCCVLICAILLFDSIFWWFEIGSVPLMLSKSICACFGCFFLYFTRFYWKKYNLVRALWDETLIFKVLDFQWLPILLFFLSLLLFTRHHYHSPNSFGTLLTMYFPNLIHLWASIIKVIKLKVDLMDDLLITILTIIYEIGWTTPHLLS